ncbi:hypothetical protein NDU88_012080 [Pleurodeles waltl]|uniref:Uncharacterized protein n=1 Tax=Pleurodeles waltl TaxID=8319 RepID=A0AAV7S4J9_PLEWA|nr:hypothetical protein NDU88_012080 [Pleurodeles waltl]
MHSEALAVTQSLHHWGVERSEGDPAQRGSRSHSGAPSLGGSRGQKGTLHSVSLAVTQALHHWGAREDRRGPCTARLWQSLNRSITGGLKRSEGDPAQRVSGSHSIAPSLGGSRGQKGTLHSVSLAVTQSLHHWGAREDRRGPCRAWLRQSLSRSITGGLERSEGDPAQCGSVSHSAAPSLGGLERTEGDPAERGSVSHSGAPSQGDSRVQKGTLQSVALAVTQALHHWGTREDRRGPCTAWVSESLRRSITGGSRGQKGTLHSVALAVTQSLHHWGTREVRRGPCTAWLWQSLSRSITGGLERSEGDPAQRGSVSHSAAPSLGGLERTEGDPAERGSVSHSGAPSQGDSRVQKGTLQSVALAVTQALHHWGTREDRRGPCTAWV